ncbi:hypothetical protein AHAS_Ahas19G0131900 [Arachis hypogaea]
MEFYVTYPKLPRHALGIRSALSSYGSMLSGSGLTRNPCRTRYFSKVLYSVIRVQSLLFAKAVPVPDDCIDPQWKWFKGCLGALGGTYIDETVSEKDKLRYRTRKGKISTNVLGSASDSRVLRDAISRPNNLKIPIEDILLEDDHVLIGEKHDGNEDGDDEMIDSVEGNNE